MRRLFLIATLLSAAPAAAEVKSSSPAGFEVISTATVAAPAAEVYTALAQPGRWWNAEHTYSGDSKNLVIDAKAGGCFCETVPADGSTIEHGRIVYAQPGKTLRFIGALGPLQQEAATGTLTWVLKPVAGGTEVTQTYIVGGHVRGGADKLAPLVDMVLAEQLAGLKRHFGTRGGG